jgi:predicted acyl esterase
MEIGLNSAVLMVSTLAIVFLGFYQNIETKFSVTFENNGKVKTNYQKPICLIQVRWKTYDAWPPKNTENKIFYLQGNKLSRQGKKFCI